MKSITRTVSMGSKAGGSNRSAGLPFDDIKTHENAFVVPFRRGMRNRDGFEAGVFSAQGDVLPNTEMRMLNRWAAPTENARSNALDGAQLLPGTWLFCGIVSAQFGHVLTRSLGMLWAVPELPKDMKLLFVSMMYKQDDHPFLSSFLEHLGIENEYKILRDPSHVEHLVTAPDLFSEVSQGEASPEYVEWVRECAIPKHNKRRKRKLYLTRGELSPRTGRYLNEDVLEKNLEKAGFEIVAPETLSLNDQLKLYAEADKIVAAEGSTLHLVPFAIRPSADLIVIQRRSEIPVLIENQIQSFCGDNVHYIDAIDHVYWPQERADNLSLVKLDFEKLRAELVECGVIKASASWKAPTQNAERLSLHAGRSESERFLSDDERVTFLRKLRRQRRARGHARLAS